MDMILIAATILMAIGIGWSIGANDAANSLGTAVGSKVLTLRQAIIMIVLFGFLGAYFQGEYVTKTIGKGIIPLQDLPARLQIVVALVATFAACLWVVIATYWKMPISTSHSIVGAVGGAGLAIHMTPDWRVLRDIFMCWICTPIGAAVLGFLLYGILKSVFPKIVPARHETWVLRMLIVASGCYVAFTWGANDVANATGLIAGAGVMTPKVSVILGGAAIALGIVTWGYKVIETIGSQITHLLPLMAFSAQLASGLNVQLYTLLGMPVSTSHSIVGAILGVGLVRGVRLLNLRIMREIVVCWLATPFISGVISFVLLKIAIWARLALQ